MWSAVRDVAPDDCCGSCAGLAAPVASVPAAADLMGSALGKPDSTRHRGPRA